MVLVNKRTDWRNFKMELAREIDLSIPIETPKDIETELIKLVNNIPTAA